MKGRHVLLMVCALIAFAAMRQAGAQQADPFERGNCENQFLEHRGEVEKRAKALQAAGKAKAPAPEICRLLRGYTAVEAKLVAFLREKQASCGIPEQMLKQSSEAHSKALEMRDHVCKVAAAPQAPPPPPPSQGLSGALGTPGYGGTPATPQGGSGVFDTLTGNVLQR
jgi:hypothetical protein